ncbi:MAG: hypothetical protein NC543_09420 [bacterium]|nr:hypothetical protein [bacterium]MCM1375682.1 hypothetical protein [Muribaculum sp.]
MSKKATGIVAYITWIGWLIAFFAGDREGAKFHLNQALVVVVAQFVVGILTWIPIVKYVAGILSLFLFVCWILGLIAACKEEEKEIPLIGSIKILK